MSYELILLSEPSYEHRSFLILLTFFVLRYSQNFSSIWKSNNLCDYDFQQLDSSQVGITIAARRYDLNSAAPFQTTDILNLQPVIKHSVPVCSEAKELIETGKIQLAEVCIFSFSTLEYRTNLVILG